MASTKGSSPINAELDALAKVGQVKLPKEVAPRAPSIKGKANIGVGGTL